MFCFQCEQTAKGTGCEKGGVCGKPPDVAALQDLLVYALKGYSGTVLAARRTGLDDSGSGPFTVRALFATLTNVNFDPERIAVLVRECAERRDALREKFPEAGGTPPEGKAFSFAPADSLEGLVRQGEEVGIPTADSLDLNIRSLRELLTYGLKGVAAYADHARILGREDEAVYGFCHEGLAATLDESLGVPDLLGLVLKCGEINLRAMEILDAAHTETYGHPVPTKVPLGTRPGKAILVSGHDLKDLDQILRLSAGKGIDVYTHGEMLPAHGYPELKKHPHLYGHYGTAWQNQHREFAAFPGAILMTTNCLQRPREEYADRIFTTGAVGWPGIPHLERESFSAVIEKALSLPGFTEETGEKSVTVGFGRNAVLSVAGAVVEAVKAGKIRHFFLVGGCDGARPGRSYYTEFVEKAPADTVILTLACGKFRFFDRDLGDIGGIPRLLDMGQCNDAYSAVKIAQALAEAFGMGVNELPLSLVLSWYEQKAVAILLTLLHLGIRNIRLGPSLPAFVSPGVLDVLVKDFGLMPITTAEADLAAILN
ncbi:MAG TPA: hydroxylamine reductase [Syntrophales bacterium]|nr:hydroxylamine reductase [Syntrophales bacterium]